MKNIFKLLLAFCSLCISAQAQLLPSIGLTQLPNDADPICAEPYYLGDYYSSGFQKGEQVNDFKLYNLQGDSLVLSQSLQQGKPILLVSGSLTCPVFRNKVATINQVASVYASMLDVYVIYTIEAHPTDTSVYFGYINVTSPNTTAGILFPSPSTYGERKAMVDTLANFVSLNVPVFIDGPCNEWWNNFGPAPNNSYLIDSNGIVRSKHGWFDKNPDDIFCDLDSLLGFNSGLCSASSNGSFVINVLNDHSNGLPTRILYDYVDIINNSTEPVSLFIKILQENVPADWAVSFCADICYTAGIDSIQITIDAMDTMHFSLDFATGLTPDSASVRLGFRNIAHPNNQFNAWLSASTFSSNTAVQVVDQEIPFFYPNPVQSVLYINNNNSIEKYLIYNTLGQVVASGFLEFTQTAIDFSQLPSAAYLLQIGGRCYKVLKH